MVKANWQKTLEEYGGEWEGGIGLEDRLKKTLEKSPFELDVWEIDSLQQLVKEQQQEIKELKGALTFEKNAHQYNFEQLEEAQQEIEHWKDIAESCECNN